jgi:isoamylase
MHVDGFRFDLASAMARGENGQPLLSPPILWSIDSDPVLAGTKIIAEAWDAAGLYQVGSFIGDRFSEWNGQFRDDVRKFVRGDSSTVQKLASRIMGSPDIYVRPDREPNRSINFITCHDGFTMYDLVSYNVKHNEGNGQNNADGANDNFSWNCGVEGKNNDKGITELRLKQMKNFFLIMFISQGTPMMLMGDEIARTQYGNNNAYCQDNETSWFNWDEIKSNSCLLSFVSKLIHFIHNYTIFQQERLLNTTENSPLPSISWHGVNVGKPDWSETSHSLAFTLSNPADDERLHVILNSYWEKLVFELPRCNDKKQWHRIIDTSKNSPDDFMEPADALAVDSSSLTVEPRSSVLLLEM